MTMIKKCKKWIALLSALMLAVQPVSAVSVQGAESFQQATLKTSDTKSKMKPVKITVLDGYGQSVYWYKLMDLKLENRMYMEYETRPSNSVVFRVTYQDGSTFANCCSGSSKRYTDSYGNVYDWKIFSGNTEIKSDAPLSVGKYQIRICCGDLISENAFEFTVKGLDELPILQEKEGRFSIQVKNEGNWEEGFAPNETYNYVKFIPQKTGIYGMKSTTTWSNFPNVTIFDSQFKRVKDNYVIDPDHYCCVEFNPTKGSVYYVAGISASYSHDYTGIEGIYRGKSHIWDSGKITKNSTCTEEGEKTYTCEADKNLQCMQETGNKNSREKAYPNH